MKEKRVDKEKGTVYSTREPQVSSFENLLYQSEPDLISLLDFAITISEPFFPRIIV